MDLILDMFEHCLLRLPQIELPTMASSDKKKGSAALDQDDLLIIEQSGAEGSECHQKGGAGQTVPQSIIDTPPLTIQVVMIDIIAIQLKLNEPSASSHGSLTSFMLSQQLLDRLFAIASLLLRHVDFVSTTPKSWAHTCRDSSAEAADQISDFLECSLCQQSLFLYQIVHFVLEQLCPKEQHRIDIEISPQDMAEWMSWSQSQATTDSGSTPPAPQQQTKQTSSTGKQSQPSTGILAQKEASQQQKSGKGIKDESPMLHMASVSAESPGRQQHEFAGLLPSEDIELGQAHSITLTDADMGHAEAAAAFKIIPAISENIFDGDGSEQRRQTDVKQQKSTAGLPANGATDTSRQCWDTSAGRFYFTIDQMPAQLRLVYTLLSNINREVNPDVQFYLLAMLKLLCLHSDVLDSARKMQEHRGFLIWIQEHLLIPRLWTLLRQDYAQVGQNAVSLVLHTITLPLGEEIFWNHVNNQFTSELWQVRFKAVDRILVLAHFVPVITVKSNRVLQTALSCAFSHLIIAASDPNMAVSQKSILVIKALPTLSLTCIFDCLIAQFDRCIIDRPLIINRIFLLSSLLSDENNILTWDFFIQRFETLALEAQLKAVQGGDYAFVQDLLRSDPMSELYQRKLTKARQSLNEAESVRSIVRSLRGNSLKHQLTLDLAMEKLSTADDSVVAPSSTVTVNFPSDRGDTQQYARMREFTDEESNLCLLLNRVVDMENPERHTVYLTVMLFVHFLSGKKCGAADNAKKQSVLLRHFNTLLGYSNTEKCFSIPPSRLRRSAIANAFLNGLPEILDTNLLIGNQMLPIVMQLLLHLPSPQKFASDQPAADYSLRLLEQLARHSWLNTLIIILYKYRCDTPSTSESIRKLVLITINTIEDQCHVCGEHPIKESDLPQVEFWTDSSGDDDNNPTISEEDVGAGDLSPNRPASLRLPERTSGTTRQEKTVRLLHPGVLTAKSPSHREVSPQRHRVPRCGYRRSSKQRMPRLQYVKLPCAGCGVPLAQFDEETISLCCIVMCTFVQRTTALAAPVLFRMVTCVTRFIDTPQYPWHDAGGEGGTGDVYVLGNSRSAAKQLIRVILYQLSGSGIAIQLFDSPIQDLHAFWSRIIFSLNDFNELNAVGLLQTLIEDITEHWPLKMTRILHNMAAYFMHVPLDSNVNQWNTVVGLLESLFRRYYTQLCAETSASVGGGSSGQQHQSSGAGNSSIQGSSAGCPPGASSRASSLYSECRSSVVIMCRVLRVQNFSTFKSNVALLEAYAKCLTEFLDRVPVELHDLLALCTFCNRIMIRERDKQILTRAIVGEMIQAIKFKCELAEPNYMTIVLLILQDFGETVDEPRPENNNNSNNKTASSGCGLAWTSIRSRASSVAPSLVDIDQYNTAASEAVRPFVNEILEFIGDLYVLSKLKKQINCDRMGGDLKGALAEVVALEMNRPAVRDSRTVMRFIPWLYSPPQITNVLPGAFADSVTNVRVLSWILLGALHTSQGAMPIPIACSNQMAEYIHFVLAGFADQSKQSVVHMSALFHAFHLCQLWTIYCEQSSNRSEETFARAMQNILEFWSRVTPAILQLLSHSKVLSDMVNLHFVNTLQALQQCNSAVLCQLYPMWMPMIATHTQIPRQLRMNLDVCEAPLDPQPIGVFLKSVRYKISQIELQTSAASPFYNV